MLNSIALIACLAVAGVLVTVGLRSLRGRGIARKVGASLCLLLALGFLALAALMVRGLSLLFARDAEVPVLHVALTPERIARGHEIAATFCGSCHSPTGEMTGGTDIGKHLPVRIGSLVAPNLTPAGPVAQWSDGEIFRAIRNGVDADGRWLIVMSYTNAGHLADEDIKSLIATMRSLAPAGEPTQVPPDQLNPLGAAMLGAGMLPRGHAINEGTVLAPMPGANVAWGQYLLSYQDCSACHGADLHGGVQGQMAPIGPDLIMVSAWSLQDFIKTMRTGIDPNDHEIQEPMPWRVLAKMSDRDLEAMFQALTRLPQPNPTGATPIDPPSAP